MQTITHVGTSTYKVPNTIVFTRTNANAFKHIQLYTLPLVALCGYSHV